MNIQGYEVTVELGQTGDDFIMNRYTAKITRTKENKSEWVVTSTRNPSTFMDYLEDNFDRCFGEVTEI